MRVKETRPIQQILARCGALSAAEQEPLFRGDPPIAPPAR